MGEGRTGIVRNAQGLNPEPREVWDYRQSVNIIRQLMGDRMFPTTIEGLGQAMRALTK